MEINPRSIWAQFVIGTGVSLFVLVLIFWSWHPPVGFYIGILGFLGVCVPLIREHVGPREKAAWTAIILVLVLLEIKSIYQDRNEFVAREQKARRDQLDGFTKIGNGIEQAIRLSQQQFAETMSRSEDTLSRVGYAIDTETGDGSYVYLEIAEAGINGPLEIDGDDGVKKGMMFGNTYVKFVGKFPLHHVFVNEIGPRDSENLIDYGDVFPVEIGRPREAPYISFYPDHPVQFFHFIISTSNGNYSQTVLVKQFGDKWLWASQFWKYGVKKAIRIWAAPGFPESDLHADWNKLDH